MKIQNAFQKKNISVCRSIVSSEGDLLFGSGICNKIMTSWFSQGIVWGVSKVMRHHVESGSAVYEEWSHMAMGMGFRAGAMGIPFLPMRSMLGSDLIGRRPEAVPALVTGRVIQPCWQCLASTGGSAPSAND